MTRTLGAIVVTLGATMLLPAQDATPAPEAGRLLAGWLSELLDLDTAAAKTAYKEVAGAQGVSRELRAVARARSIEIARIEGDLEGARELLQRSVPESDDSRLRQPLEQDLLEGLRQKPPDTDVEALHQWRGDVRRQLSTFSPGRPMRSETRWLLSRFADRVDVSEDERTRVRRLRTQLAEAHRDRDATRARQLAEELRQWERGNQPAQKRLGLQILDLRLRGPARAAARFAQASLVPPSSALAIGDADLSAAVERLRRALGAELRGRPSIEADVLGRLRERVDRLADAGELRSAVELVRGVPYFEGLLLGDRF